jgi:hypothetical protein
MNSMFTNESSIGIFEHYRTQMIFLGKILHSHSVVIALRIFE